MRSLAESTKRWQETFKHGSSLVDLQRAVKDDEESSPCISGCRSICWKIFLLSQPTGTADNWTHSLLEVRESYTSFREHLLKYVTHPEYLNAETADPLADDPDSPWNTLRRDEVLRAEILQDVQRLPELSFYHEPRVQTLILDVLFIYCKLNPDVGGYRQGMHELLAPLVYALDQDAIDPVDTAPDASADSTMMDMLDASFIEHDAFALFSKLMEHAKSFYEVGDAASKNPSSSSGLGQQSPTSSIVERSQHIHEVCLRRIDPELSDHLKDIEVLPQVFIIRWIRLLFSREFPFDQTFILWDTLFSLDPKLQLIDFICTAMLIRIRWDLLEADYSVALQLLLKYPSPQPPHGPHTFVGDAIYLRDHQNPINAGSTLITKYTGRPPTSGTDRSRSSTPNSWSSSMRRKATGTRSPLSPQRFIAQQGGVEALFQGAAKGVLERGEKLGINQAVRDAMVEIRRNVSEARSSIKANRDLYPEPRPNTTTRGVAMMEQRNKQLAAMLDDTISKLKALATSPIDDQKKHIEELEVAAAKVQFVKVYLEDSTMTLPEQTSIHSPVAEYQEDTTFPESLDEVVAAMNLDGPKDSDSPSTSSPAPLVAGPKSPTSSSQADLDDIEADPLGLGIATPIRSAQRPQAPIPTRSTLAQSSFSWMIESGQSSPSQASAATPKAKAPNNPHRKRPSANANRERTAFLFGEVPPDENGLAALPEDMFGMELMGKSKS